MTVHGRGHDHEDRLAVVDQGDRAVLELARGEALGVDVRELLELERALHGHRVADVAAEEQDGGGVGHRAGELLDLVLAGEDLLDLAGDRPEIGRAHV